MHNPSPRFTGIFIPAEILAIEDLTPFEMILISWIDALYCPDHGGCYASNEYLGKKIRDVEANTVAKSLTKLRRMGLIEDISYDGHKRVIRALIHRYVDKNPRRGGLDLNPKGGVGFKSNSCWTEIQGGLDDNPTPIPPVLIYESKVDIKEREREEVPLPLVSAIIQEKKTQSNHESYGSYVKLLPEQYDALCMEMGKPLVDHYIEAMNAYMPNAPKAYKDYSGAIRQWWVRDKSAGTVPKLTKTQEPINNLSSDKVQRNRRICEVVEQKLKNLFTGEVFFQAFTEHAWLINSGKGIKEIYYYGCTESEKLKEKLLVDLCNVFPNAKELLR